MKKLVKTNKTPVPMHFEEYNINQGESKKDESAEILKELVNVKDIDTKTDLTIEQINAMSKVMVMQRLFQSKFLENINTSYMRLLLSKDRQSRKEIIDSFKLKKEAEQRALANEQQFNDPVTNIR